MFDFEKLEVYKVARILNKEVLEYVFAHTGMDSVLQERLKKSSLSTVLFLSEGVGRMDDAEKRSAITSARSAVYECVTLMHLLLDLDQLDPELYKHFYDRYEQLSKMLLGMYRSKV